MQLNCLFACLAGQSFNCIPLFDLLFSQGNSRSFSHLAKKPNMPKRCAKDAAFLRCGLTAIGNIQRKKWANKKRSKSKRDGIRRHRKAFNLSGCKCCDIAKRIARRQRGKHKAMRQNGPTLKRLKTGQIITVTVTVTGRQREIAA